MKRRILLVDDELTILLTLKAVLELNGFEVSTAASALEAKQKLQTAEFEMVITDMKMEHETAGFEVIHAARQQKYNPATAILTAYPSLGNDWQTRGAHSLLVKPVNTPDLLRQLEALLVTHADAKAQNQKVPEARTTPQGKPARNNAAHKAV